ncbi:hypothetical protein [Lactiplantibacillus paraplantarum]|uniref:hypothetical protein n=1 Tax=Lactiplantibacillus paraplantarum TaxID=60520 RepID=UPI000A544D71|nr:hypothetical protein [Lactiplantibacillus paraplantarum]
MNNLILLTPAMAKKLRQDHTTLPELFIVASSNERTSGRLSNQDWILTPLQQNNIAIV